MQVNKEHCGGCKYMGTIGGSGSSPKCCDYLLLTGHLRGCSVENCDKKEIGKRNPKRFGFDQKGVIRKNEKHKSKVSKGRAKDQKNQRGRLDRSKSSGDGGDESGRI